MDARLILAGRSPDFAGSMARGTDLAVRQNEAQRGNALAQLYQTQGPGIAAGDPGALNALAQFDPAAAQGVRIRQEDQAYQMQDRAQSQAMERERLQIARDAAKRAGEEYARTLSAEQRAAQAAEIERGLAGAVPLVRAGDVAGYNAWLQSQGLDPAQYPMEQFPSFAASLVGLSEALKVPEGPKFRPATPEEAARYGAVSGQINDETGQFTAINPPSGMSLRTNPDGTMTMVQGPGAGSAGGTFTEGQAKDNVFVTRAEGALAQLDPVSGALTNRTETVLGAVPLGIGREAQSETFQVAQQAGDEFLQAILRKDTGAAITAQEQALYGETYLPRPGDGPAVLEAKRQSRIRAVEAMRAGMNVQQITATEKALVEAARRSGQAPEAVDDETLMRQLLGGN